MKRKTVRFRLFVTCLCIFLVPVCLLGIVGGRWAVDTVRGNTEESYAATLANVASRFDEDLENLTDVVTLLSKDPLIARLTHMQGDSVDYQRISARDLHNFKTSLIFQRVSSNLYSDLAICFPTKNVVISTLGLWNLDWFLEDEFNVASMSHEEWMALFEGGNSEHFIRNAEMKTFGHTKNGIISVRTAERNSAGAAMMSVLFWIDDSQLDAYLSDLALFPGTIAVLRDAAGETVHVYPQTLLAQQGALEGISANAKTATLQDEKYHVMSFASDKTGWGYMVLLPQAEIFAQVHTLYRVLAIIIIVMLVLGCLLSLELAHINYRPLARAFAAISRYLASPENAPADEMAQIESMLMGMVEKQEVLRRQIESNRGMLQYAALSHLLEGDASSRKLIDSHTLGLLGLPMPYGHFHVGISENEAGGPAHPGEGIVVYAVRQKGQVTVIINHDAPGIADWCASVEARGYGLALSACHADVDDLPTALEEAMYAWRHMPAQPGHVVRYGQVEPHEHAVPLSDQLERQMIGAVKEGDQARALLLFDQFLEKRLDRMTHETARKCSLAIELAMLKTDDDRGSLARILMEIQPPNDHVPQSHLIYARELLIGTSAYHSIRLSRQQNAFTEDLIAYISEHICDPQLSLTSVAATFSVSTTFLSRYFKEQMHTGYLDYVNRKRIAIAREMLLEGNMAIKDIALACGFASDTTFRRLFKKYEGSAPSRLEME